MAAIDKLTSYMPSFGSGQLGEFAAQVGLLLLGGGIIFFFAFRILKYKIPVEIWRFTPSLTIETDTAAIKKKDGLKRLVLLKNKNKQIDNFMRYPIKKGLFKKTVNKLYLTEENGALRGLQLTDSYNFFSANGELLDVGDVHYDGEDGELEPLKDAQLYTRDGAEVYAQRVPSLAPSNNDSQNAYALEILDANAKYHIPAWYEKMQSFAVIIAGIVAAVVFLIMTRA